MRRRSLYLAAPRKLVWQQEELSAPGPSELLVETVAGAVSVGAELPQYLGVARGGPEGYPRMTGYENIAVVRECGPGWGEVALGDRIVASYGHMTHALVPEAKAVRVPEGVDDRLALLSILSCDVAKGVRKLALMPEERVLVAGAGAIGLLAVFVLRAYGVRSVDVLEPDPARRKFALALGAAKAVSPVASPDLPGPYPACLECSAREEAFGLLQRAAARGGRLCVLSDGNLEPLSLGPEFHEKELSVAGSSDGWDYRKHAEWFFGLVADGQADELGGIFEAEITAVELPSAFERLGSGLDRPLKILVRYPA